MHVSEGFIRIVVETSPDGGEPYDREVIARGNDAVDILDAYRLATTGDPDGGSVPPGDLPF